MRSSRQADGLGAVQASTQQREVTSGIGGDGRERDNARAGGSSQHAAVIDHVVVREQVATIVHEEARPSLLQCLGGARERRHRRAPR
jgi:hypothetical protein